MGILIVRHGYSSHDRCQPVSLYGSLAGASSDSAETSSNRPRPASVTECRGSEDVLSGSIPRKLALLSIAGLHVVGHPPVAILFFCHQGFTLSSWEQNVHRTGDR